MRFLGFFAKATMMMVAAAFVVTLLPADPVSAREPRWWDHVQKKWRTGPKPVRRRVFSNKSPIRKRRVSIDKKYAPGTIIIDTSERRLYYVMSRGRAMKYGVGVGRDGFQWSGTHRITRKAEWPDWRPPQTMIRRVKRRITGFLPAGRRRHLARAATR